MVLYYTAGKYFPFADFLELLYSGFGPQSSLLHIGANVNVNIVVFNLSFIYPAQKTFRFLFDHTVI